MIAAARVYHLARADFLERTRRYGFLIVMGLTLYVGYMMVPPVDATYNAFSIGGHRPFYSSAWIGTIFGTVCATLLTLIGFFLIRNSVARDRETRVGRIIAGTPTTRLSYVMGKWSSNLAVLAAILGILTLVAPLMQLVRGEDRHLDLLAMAGSLWTIGLPPLAVVAALAVFFETAPVLRGPLGSFVFVAAWVAFLVFPIGAAFSTRAPMPPISDVAGLSPSMASLYAAAGEAGLDLDPGATDLFEPTHGRAVSRFHWTGAPWSAERIAMRGLWLGVALGVAAAAAVPFDRFDTSRARGRRGLARRRRRGRAARAPRGEEPSHPATDDGGAVSIAAPVRLTRLEARRTGLRLPTLVWSELRTMIRGRAWWWWGAALALILTSLLVPARIARGIIAPGLWLLPVAIWSAMGNREMQWRTTPYVFSTPHPVKRQLWATWLAGVLIGLVIAVVGGVRPLLAGDMGHVVGLVVGAWFVPSLALALGTWTDGRRAFEVAYTVLWYLGVFGHMTPFDLLGVSSRAAEAGVPGFYAALIPILLGAAAVGRTRQLQRPAG